MKTCYRTIFLLFALVGLASNGIADEATSLAFPPSQEVVRLTVTHPEETRAGRSYEYQIRVENVSDNIAVHDLKLEQRSEGTIEVESATIEGEKQSNTDATEQSNDQNHAWTVSSLKPGQKKTINLRAVSDKEGEANLCFAITSYTPTLCLTPKFVKPDVQLTKKAPEQVSLCEVIHFEYEVTNSGSGDPGRFEISDDLGNLITESGNQKLRFEVDGLKPGETRRFVADIVATKAGEYSSRAEAILSENERAKSKPTTTKVISPQLAVAVDGPSIAYNDDPIQYTVRVTNDGNADADEVTLRVQFPTQMAINLSGQVHDSDNAVERSNAAEGEPTPAEKSSASDNKKNSNKKSEPNSASQSSEQQMALENREIDLDGLAAGATKEITFVLRGDADREFPVRATAQFICRPGDSDERYEVTSMAMQTTELVSLPALLVAVVDERDPVKVEDEVTYEIVVRNQGSAAAKNVQIEAELPEQLKFVSAKGPTDAQKPNGKKIAFKKVDTMEPGGQAVWHLRAKVTQSGDARLKVHLTSDSLDQPATSEEPTRLFGQSG